MAKAAPSSPAVASARSRRGHATTGPRSEKGLWKIGLGLALANSKWSCLFIASSPCTVRLFLLSRQGCGRTW
jgi:hypothetical protein